MMNVKWLSPLYNILCVYACVSMTHVFKWELVIQREVCFSCTLMKMNMVKMYIFLSAKKSSLMVFFILIELFKSLKCHCHKRIKLYKCLWFMYISFACQNTILIFSTNEQLFVRIGTIKHAPNSQWNMKSFAWSAS